MAIKKTVTIWLLFLLLIHAGKVYAATFEGHHLATEIDIAYRQEHRQVLRSFRQSNNMEAILNYLRLLEYDGMPGNDPEQQRGDTYKITVHLADGKHHIYYLHADCYLSRDFRPWVKVESSRPLSELLKALPEES